LNLKKDVHYKTTAEGALHLDLYYPEKDLTGEYPVVIYTHGGGWAAGDKRGAWQAKKGDEETIVNTVERYRNRRPQRVVARRTK
jgi:carboxylesterase type B